MPAIPYPLLLIQWDDSCSHGDSWTHTGDLHGNDFETTNHVSVGWEIKRTAKALTIAPNLGCIGDKRNECIACHFTIPLATITRETVLRKAAPQRATED